MRVSVAIPCYNGVAYIGRAIEAVMAQTLPADEILVVDDCSTDNSAGVISSYPVTLLSHSVNQGIAAARNTALQKAQSDILVFVDADAFAAPNLIEVLLADYANRDPSLAGVGGQGVESNVHSLADRWRRAHATQGHGPQRKYVSHLFGLCMSYQVSALQQVGGFNTTFRTNAEDMDIGLRLNAAGFRLVYSPGAQVFHQRSDDIQSLQRAMAAWYGAAYRAMLANHAQPWTLFAGTLRRIIQDPFRDLLTVRDPALVPLSLSMNYFKLKTLWHAWRG